MRNASLKLALFGFIFALASALPAAAQGVFDVQVYWNGDRPYYYDTNHDRHYVSVYQAQQWYQRRDPDYWRQHHDDWRQGNYQQWDRDYERNHEHTERQYQKNYGSGGNNYGH
ncbi:MAG: hypothetical protein JO092_05230 [Candidatus Eremiobacteraeota bacterium]|nr:hypothetical protein [Candidatus Eremiobacteraeota bacterium]